MVGSRDVERLREVVSSYAQPTVPAAYRQYFTKHHASVQGWLFSPIMSALGVIVDVQTRAGYAGGFAEIGVHHGRFYCALAMAREGGWRGIAIDIFEDQHLNPDGSGKGNLKIFKGNMQRLGLDLADHTIVQSDSKIVPADRVRSAVGGDGVLVFSVDGAHTVDYTVADLDLAAQSLHPCGVIVLDDVFNPRWPGVIEGALNWLNGPSGAAYEMIAYGNNKGFIAHRDLAPVYRTLLAGPPGLPVSDNDAVVLAGRPCLFCHFSEPSHLFQAEGAAPTASRVLDFVRRGNGLRALRDGWSRPESHGTWSSAARAKLAIPQDRDWALRTCRIDLHALVPAGHSQHLKVFHGDREVASLALSAGNRTLDVPLTLDGSNDADTIELTFETAHRFNPAALGLSNDDREIGILLKRITLAD